MASIGGLACGRWGGSDHDTHIDVGLIAGFLGWDSICSRAEWHVESIASDTADDINPARRHECILYYDTSRGSGIFISVYEVVQGFYRQPYRLFKILFPSPSASAKYPFEIFSLPSNRAHKALHRGTFGGCSTGHR